MSLEQMYIWDLYTVMEITCPARQDTARLGDGGDQGPCLVVSGKDMAGG